MKLRPDPQGRRRQNIENCLLWILSLVIFVWMALAVMYKLGRIELATVEAASVLCGLVGAGSWLWTGLRD